jgi:hypothetical protein
MAISLPFSYPASIGRDTAKTDIKTSRKIGIFFMVVLQYLVLL